MDINFNIINLRGYYLILGLGFDIVVMILQMPAGD